MLHTHTYIHEYIHVITYVCSCTYMLLHVRIHDTCYIHIHNIIDACIHTCCYMHAYILLHAQFFCSHIIRTCCCIHACTKLIIIYTLRSFLFNHTNYLMCVALCNNNETLVLQLFNQAPFGCSSAGQGAEHYVSLHNTPTKIHIF